MYVANSASNSISVYAPGASGDVAPLRVISGPNTGISNPWSVALDAAGRVYVANSDSITVYAPGVGGPPGSPTANAAPIRAISGFSARVWGPIGLALDAAGYLYVSNATANSITVYAPGSGGPLGSSAANVAPIRTISGPRTGLSLPYLIFLRP